MLNESATLSSLRLDLKSSRYCALAILIQYLTVISVLCCTPLFLSVQIGLVILCTINFITTLQQQVLLTAKQAIKIIILHNHQWLLIKINEEIMEVELLGQSFSSFYFILLNFKVKTQRQKIAVMLWHDSMDPTSWRRLRAYLAFAKSRHLLS